MNQNNQQLTKATYEDPQIVEGYIKRNALQPKQAELIESFVKTIAGKRVLDLGCGPGQDSYIFAELGFKVTGLDYSEEMINRAKTLKSISNPPEFMVGDMREISNYFAANTFEAIWASASLLHIQETDIPRTLQGINTVCKNGAKIYIGLKGGEGTILVNEDKLGKPMQREFVLWTKESFLQTVKPLNWHLDDFYINHGSTFMGKPTEWLRFFFTVSK